MQWHELPNRNTNRNDFACGFIKAEDGTTDIVVAGGCCSTDYVEMMTLTDSAALEWRDGPPLPRKLHDAKSVQFDNHFLVIGGRYGQTPGDPSADLIYQFDSSQTWNEAVQSLKTPRSQPVALQIPEKYARCN